MKNLFAIIGNISSGKSTIIRLVVEKIKLPVFAIDDYRIQHNSFTIKKENEAWCHLVSDIKNKDTAIFEFSGVSRQKHEVFRLFDRVVIIKLNCSEKTLSDRLFDRKRNLNYHYVPYPFRQRIRFDSWQTPVVEIQRKLYNERSDYQLDSEITTPEENAEKIIEIIKKTKWQVLKEEA